MAKMYGLGGVLSGKLGNTVLAIRSGVQIARQYQPIVNNPKSSGQQLQRAKGNLVGQVSKITPWQVITGLGISKSRRRSRYLRLLLRNATSNYVSGSVSEISAKLYPSDIIFSEGAVLPVFYINSATAGATSVALSVTRRPGVSDDEYAAGGVMFVVLFAQASGVYESISYQVLTGESATEGVNTVYIAHPYEGSYVAHVYMVPFSSADGTKLTTIAKSMTGDSTGLSALLTNNPSALSLDWGNSTYILEETYTP